MSSDLHVDVSGGVAVLTLNRPAQQNALTPAMAAELGAALRRCDTEDAIGAVVITGTPPAFCAGADLSAKVGEVSGSIDPAPFRIRKPVIAAVNGHAVGIGLEIALQCDLRYVARDAVYGLNQVRRGAVADGYAHWTLPRLIGMAHAADILLTGRTFDGEEAAAIGLANNSLPGGEVLPTALAVAHDIANGSAPLPTALSKRLLWEGLGMTPETVGRLETDLNGFVARSADGGEGIAALRDRRQPKWSGSVSGEWPSWDTGDQLTDRDQPRLD
ncbi:Probable enoyl-CoA hydratase echA8 [Nocardia otitidiscaviarum]|uniref:Enoyl-CoA hydratase/isomerase family protein n=1 Tax=Nocardia otitidiscaviarum TaxID=1823 RepID=A0A378YEI0_9NOCA|nr:enoyl-CoA hydratase/isomerase family protein [Nocardia otitidiscaviarum]MBF6236221.1 enoyl-CoA hydratase/isomerase family protein [Nocardia otitidiscaviarum]MCP9621477.1 enoyl-CoA hydratase/isomerase family protein [Nocardia otitidiscaviarum]QDP82174.1 enoyl-CoA hydratase/isomerase family protein [Nocardia otitidiscaviarum]SUA75645.1 Probable enoyl-CoA hydratase echA8 [Nocardia otitidiscaviarum]